MEKSEIVNKFLQEGFLLSPKILDKLTEEKISQLLPEIKTKNILVLTELDEPEITFTIKKQAKPKSVTVKDIAEYYSKKYSAIKTILSAKLDPISINNLKNGSQQTIIGLISGSGAAFFAEDSTGKIELVCDKQMQQNSILGLAGQVKENKFFVSGVFYPDIPLDKKIKEIDFKLIFRLEKGQPIILVNGREIKDFPMPTTASIKKGQTTNILVYKPEQPLTKNQLVEALKLRCLPEPKIPSENYIIEDEPDLFWVIQKDSWVENYKGVKIISGESAEIGAEPGKYI